MADERGVLDALTERFRGRPWFRSAYATAVAVGTIGGYKALNAGHRVGLVREREAAIHRHHEASARRVYRGVVRLQGLMIKIGQSIGSNPAAVPEEYVRILSRLQDAVPPRPWPVMRRQIKRALGRRLGDVFAEFDRAPVGAASLAQVYRARLHDGREVAVKVLYPGIERLVRSDLRVLRFLLWLDSRVAGYPLEPIYAEMAANVPLEVDLVHEAHATERMAALLSDEPSVVIPAIIWEHTSRRLLVMEWIEGIKVTRVEALRAAGIDVQRVADVLTDTYCRQMLVHGFFHADPHPGNLFALPGDRLAIVDFGLTKELSPAFRRTLGTLTRAMFVGDMPAMVGAFGELGFEVERGEDHRVWLATAEFIRTITDPSTYGAGGAAMNAANDQWVGAVKKNPFIAIPGDMTLVSRVFSLLTGVGAGMGADPRVMEMVLKYTSDA